MMNGEQSDPDTADESLLDDLFHGCAFAAFMEQAAIQNGWPDVDATRMLANRSYEEELAIKNRDRQRADPAKID